MNAPEHSLTRADDGCYHPRTEEELCALVKHAHDHHKRLRVLGSSHSVWRAIVTDHFAGAKTPDDELQVVLDHYTRVFDPVGKLVEVQAGCHLGASPLRPVQGRIAPGGARQSDVLRPSPWHDETWEASLNSQLHHKWGLALSDLGGISHQTVAGFLSTGSSGGTTRWSVHDSIVRLRVIDGEGRVHELHRDRKEHEEWFRAALVGLGLVGVISTVTFQCEPRYDVVGTETISETMKSDGVDFYANRPQSGLPQLDRFLVDTDYTRIMWWPQYGFDRLVLWQAKRAPYDPNLKVQPYHEIATFPILSQVAISVIYTILGNIETPERIKDELAPLRARADIKDDVRNLGRLLRGPPVDPDFPYEPQRLFPWLSWLVQTLQGERHDPVTLGAVWIPLVQLFVIGSDELIAFFLGLPLVKQLFALLGEIVPSTLQYLYQLFISTGPNGSPATQRFQDRWLLGLPMDNQMDDLILPTWFTELWIPFEVGDGTVNGVIKELRKLFDADGTAKGAYAATGAFAFELYAAKAEPHAYLSCATGKKNVFRVDVFWFARNAGDPVYDFYPQFWRALERFDYRCHWGKFVPANEAQRERLRQRFAHLETFKRVRAKVDPRDVFVTRYWRELLSL